MKWQPIETAPKDGTRILAAVGDSAAIVYFLDIGIEDIDGWRTDEHRIIGLKHWMPLPEPPK